MLLLTAACVAKDPAAVFHP